MPGPDGSQGAVNSGGVWQGGVSNPLMLWLIAFSLVQPVQPSPVLSPDQPARLQATEVRRWQVPEARQGVAVDGQHFYAVAGGVLT